MSAGNRLLVYQALWGMTALTSPEVSVGEKFDRVKAAGFDGMNIDLGALPYEEAEATIPHFKRTGLAGGLTAFPASVDDLKAAIDLARRIEAPFLVLIGQDMPVRLADMVSIVERWLRVAADEGMPVQFETHRNCITNDLYTCVQLLDALPQLQLAADLSHYVVDREMSCPPTAALQALMKRVTDRSESFQGRVAARGQIQLPLDFPQSAKWVALFKDWWRQWMTAWHTRHREDNATTVFLSELGPPDYALTDRQGHEFSDRWAESLTFMRWAREIWQECLPAHSA